MTISTKFLRTVTYAMCTLLALAACSEIQDGAPRALTTDAQMLYNFESCEQANNMLSAGSFTSEFASACEHATNAQNGESLHCLIHRYTGACVNAADQNRLDVGQRCVDVKFNVGDCDAGKVVLLKGNGYSPTVCRTSADKTSCEVAPVGIPEGKQCRVNLKNTDIVSNVAIACSFFDDSAFYTPYVCEDIKGEIAGTSYCVSPPLGFIPKACIPSPNLAGQGGLFDQLCGRYSTGTPQKVQKSETERVLVDGYSAHACVGFSTLVGKNEQITEIDWICEVR
jgi:hypothetical protein